MINEKIIVAGFGGQGVLSIGKMIATSGMKNGLEVSFLPSYSSEMRGGTCNCNVIVSQDPVDAPVISKPNTLIVMNGPSLDKFESWAVPGARLIINSSLVTRDPVRTDLKVYKIPFNDLATEAGNERGMNMMVAGAYAAISGSIPLDSIYEAIEHTFTGAKAKFVPGNKQMAKLGYDYAKTHF